MQSVNRIENLDDYLEDLSFDIKVGKRKKKKKKSILMIRKLTKPGFK